MTHAQFWPESQAAEMVTHLAQGAGQPVETAPASHDPALYAQAMGLEAESVRLNGGEIDAALRTLAPGFIHIAGRGYLAVAKSSRTRLKLLAPDLTLVSMTVPAAARLVRSEASSSIQSQVEQLADRCGLSGRARERAIDSLLDERLRGRLLAPAWQLRIPPGRAFVQQLKDAGLLRRAAIFVGSHILENIALLIAWLAIGQGALSGRIDFGWLTAWACLLITMIPLRALTTWSQGMLAIGAGGLLKQRLLAGALTLDPDLMRKEGAGELLGRVNEGEQLESLALSGGLASLLSIFDLVIAALVISRGASAALQLPAFLIWVAFCGSLAARYIMRRRAWAKARLKMTHHLVENMTGHRTRLAQQPVATWHAGEDEELSQYLRLSEGLDRAGARLTALAGRGWMLISILAIAPEFLASRSNTTTLALALGGMLLGQQALRRTIAGLAQLGGAWIAWDQVKPMFEAAAHQPARGSAILDANSTSENALEAYQLTYRYPGQSEPVLKQCSLVIRTGDSFLLEGSSGGGKSTLAAVLAGLRAPQSGLLLSSGLDPHTLGVAGWRKRIAVAPQYHENHILAAPLVFNLLLGRNWPPTEADRNEAVEVCRELGLGPLLERMPGGLEQMVGETGWQLSQGERSRIYIARALLQQASVVMLDESFAALDPENLRLCLECVLKRAPTLVVVAHP
ncbi:MAG TPA: ABC transporter ATP-binding protein [Bryobacteraceae bacterium]|jgi:ATP-binding cassette subfamily B protein